MFEKLKAADMIILLLLCPPVGALAVCSRKKIPVALKILSVIWCIAILAGLLLLHSCPEPVKINAVRY